MKRSLVLTTHVQFFLPIIEVLKKLGGSASPTELKDSLIDMLQITEKELQEVQKNGVSVIDNQIIWSKIYLVREGLVDATDPSLWKLTEDGFSRNISESEVGEIFKRIHSMFTKKKKSTETEILPIATDANDEACHKAELLNILKSIAPNGFERLCQRLLRASGFKKVEVKGRSGDGGIDGEGILEINPLVSLKVIFQAKRYKDSVSSPQIRDFRGAIQGRADKGIFITTGRFTQDAKNEALRDGTSNIELVDGDKLIQLFEQKQLGLKQKTYYEVDYDFFKEYE